MVEEIRGGCIRVRSSMNEWMDCIFIVSEDDTGRAAEVLRRAWDDFWRDDEGWCYGDFLKGRLAESGIAFDVYYADAEGPAG